ncbi:MAG: hypothetical protein QOI21_3843 [Actinomycetota bacterium]|jgi:hypothetical protein|nr:hypothetical protein [Actinomycetota bacterium]
MTSIRTRFTDASKPYLDLAEEKERKRALRLSGGRPGSGSATSWAERSCSR